MAFTASTLESTGHHNADVELLGTLVILKNSQFFSSVSDNDCPISFHMTILPMLVQQQRIPIDFNDMF